LVIAWTLITQGLFKHRTLTIPMIPISQKEEGGYRSI